jgi:hypothetical protein
MSAGGQRGIDISGVTSLRIQHASDATKRTQVRLVYQTFASTTGANAYRNWVPNANGSLIEFLQGVKDCSSGCVGLPQIQWNLNRSFQF